MALKELLTQDQGMLILHSLVILHHLQMMKYYKTV